MPTRADYLQAMATATQYVADLEAENAQLKAQLTPTPVPETAYGLLGMITDFKIANDMVATAKYHLKWMADLKCRVVRIWHSVDPVTGGPKWNLDAINLAAAYLANDPNIVVILCTTPPENHPAFTTMAYKATFDAVVVIIPAAYRSRFKVELINEPNLPKFWNCTGGVVSAFKQMAAWSVQYQAAGIETISPSVTQPYAGNVAGEFANVAAADRKAFTYLGYHCYQNDPVEFAKCLGEAKKIAKDNKGLALTEWAQMVYKEDWVPPIPSFVPLLPQYVKAVAENTALSAYFIATPHDDIKKAHYLFDPATTTKTDMYQAFKTQYTKYASI